MREKQCKYVNVFVYSFYLFFSSLLPPPPPPAPCANETSMVRHMWSLFAGRGAGFGPSAGATVPNKATPRAGGTLPQPLTSRATRTGVLPARGFDLFTPNASFSCSPMNARPGKAPVPQNSQHTEEKSHQISNRDFAFHPFMVDFFSY